MLITTQEFLSRPLDALTFYDILPSDGVTVVDAPPLCPTERLLAGLLAARSDVAEEFLNDALLGLLPAPAVDAVQATAAADHISRLYASMLAGGKRDRGRRMKLQQINFFLRNLIDISAGSDAAAAEVSGAGPWDWLPMVDGQIAIFSGADGLWHTSRGQTRRFDVGYPSQLDALGSDRVSVGSIFTPGATIWSESGLVSVEHDLPIVLILDWAGEDVAIAYDGTIFALSDRQPLWRLDMQQVDRVRRIGSQLIAVDWSTPDAITVFDLDTRRQERSKIAPVILLNDICLVGERYYAICKQQGRVFSFDASFVCLGERLSFGRRSTQLFDPLSLRYHENALHVLNWVTGTRVTLPLF